MHVVHNVDKLESRADEIEIVQNVRRSFCFQLKHVKNARTTIESIIEAFYSLISRRHNPSIFNSRPNFHHYCPSSFTVCLRIFARRRLL